jgi:hypothetical protein
MKISFSFRIKNQINSRTRKDNKKKFISPHQNVNLFLQLYFKYFLVIVKFDSQYKSVLLSIFFIFILEAEGDSVCGLNTSPLQNTKPNII